VLSPVTEDFVVPQFTSVVSVPLVLLAPTPWLVVTPATSTPVALVVVPQPAPAVVAPAPVAAPAAVAPAPYVAPVRALKPYRN